MAHLSRAFVRSLPSNTDVHRVCQDHRSAARGPLTQHPVEDPTDIDLLLRRQMGSQETSDRIAEKDSVPELLSGPKFELLRHGGNGYVCQPCICEPGAQHLGI
jgi:hypothetical protein